MTTITTYTPDMRAAEDRAQFRADVRDMMAHTFMLQVSGALLHREAGELGQYAADLGWSRGRAAVYARLAEEVPPEHWRYAPISTIKACLDAADQPGPAGRPHSAAVWLRWAIVYNRSARQVRDAADQAQGRRVSRVPLANGRHLYTRHGDQLHITVPDMTGIDDGASGEADVKIYQVLKGD